MLAVGILSKQFILPPLIAVIAASERVGHAWRSSVRGGERNRRPSHVSPFGCAVGAREPAEQVIEGAVLLHEEDDLLDLARALSGLRCRVGSGRSRTGWIVATPMMAPWGRIAVGTPSRCSARAGGGEWRQTRSRGEDTKQLGRLEARSRPLAGCTHRPSGRSRAPSRIRDSCTIDMSPAMALCPGTTRFVTPSGSTVIPAKREFR